MKCESFDKKSIGNVLPNPDPDPDESLGQFCSVSCRGNWYWSQKLIRWVQHGRGIRLRIRIAQDVVTSGFCRRCPSLEEAEQVVLSWGQVIGEPEASLPEEKAEEQADTHAEDGHGKSESGHRSGRVSRPQKPVRTWAAVRGWMYRFGGHLKRVTANLGELKHIFCSF